MRNFGRNFLACLVLILLLQSCENETEDVLQPETITELPFTSMKLEDLTEFQPLKSKKWMIGGDAYSDRKTKNHMEAVAGKGVLIDIPTDDDKVNIFTKMEHGDMDLQIDFMIPKGSNSGIYLQGRYEVQLYDSWMKDSVGFVDCGGIYERWKDDKGYEGKAPQSNACRAPGLWQKIFISFRAPKFDNSGRKIANAVFREVRLNGTLIHSNLEVTGPTRSAAFEDEKPLGPLMIQGDHGPVAFRNIRFKTFGNDSITLEKINFKVYKTFYRSYDTLKNFTPERIGTSDTLSWMVGDRKAQLVLEGNMNIPKDGDYLFKIKGGGASWFFVDDKEALDNNNTRDYTHAFFAKLNLKAGKHPFKIVYANQDESLALEYEGPGIPFKTLTTPASERHEKEIEPFEYKLENEPTFQRGFFKSGEKINPYAIAVGIPGGINYAYDLSTYAPLSVWRGKYIDVSNMWTDRGESQREIPLGTPVDFDSRPNLAALESLEDAWPDTVSVDNNVYTNRGYRIDEKGLPVFLYQFGNASAEDYFEPSADKSALIRKVKISFTGSGKDLYFLLATGRKIEKLANGSYAVDDKRFYIEDISGIDLKNIQAFTSKTGYNLVVAVTVGNGSSTSFHYSLIW